MPSLDNYLDICEQTCGISEIYSRDVRADSLETGKSLTDDHPTKKVELILWLDNCYNEYHPV
jgi:hypothetical protein